MSKDFTTEEIKRKLDKCGNFHLQKGDKTVHFYRFKGGAEDVPE